MEIWKGDKVRIKTWKQMELEFGVSTDGEIPCYQSFVPEMAEYCGKVLTVSSMPKKSRCKFRVLEDTENEYTFSEDMVAEVISE